MKESEYLSIGLRVLGVYFLSNAIVAITFMLFVIRNHLVDQLPFEIKFYSGLSVTAAKIMISVILIKFPITISKNLFQGIASPEPSIRINLEMAAIATLGVFLIASNATDLISNLFSYFSQAADVSSGRSAITFGHYLIINLVSMLLGYILAAKTNKILRCIYGSKSS